MISILIFGLVAASSVADAAVITSPLGNTMAKLHSTAQFQVHFSNTSVNDTYEWNINTDYVGNVVITGENSTKIEGFNATQLYNLTANASLSNVWMTLKIKNVSDALRDANISVIGRNNLSSSALLLVTKSCPAVPFDASCLDYMCVYNTSTYNQTTGSSSAEISRCYNSSTCNRDGQWSNATVVCIPIGCATPGRWGTGCSKTCGKGCPVDGKCEFATGMCLAANGLTTTNCKTGYHGMLCDKIGCASPGRWGIGCNMTCGKGCPMDGKCEFATGMCLAANGSTTTNCKTGYHGMLCDKHQCMTPGRWGTGCNMTCGRGCPVQGKCDLSTGTCLTANGSMTTSCKAGYIGTLCNQVACDVNGTWGENCTKLCGFGCPSGICDFRNGSCLSARTMKVDSNCLPGYRGAACDKPICGDCNGGQCLAPNFCGLCPVHFEAGVTCRNIRLDGFLKGSLPTFAILTAAVVLLSVSSKWYTKRKLKDS